MLRRWFFHQVVPRLRPAWLFRRRPVQSTQPQNLASRRDNATTSGGKQDSEINQQTMASQASGVKNSTDADTLNTISSDINEVNKQNELHGRQPDEEESRKAEELAKSVADISLKDQKSKASVEVKYAYHVTNVEVQKRDGKPCNQPDWSELRRNLADDKLFDGEILFGVSCVFFTTTLYDGRLPDKTMYPRNGVITKEYWRVKVPLTEFDNYKIINVHEYKKQVGLLLLKTNEADKIPGEKLDKRNADEYLRREKRNPGGVKYYSNDYNDAQTKYFVNVVVCHDFPLSADVQWDCVEHKWNMPGNPEGEKLRERSLDEVLQSL